MGEVNNPLEAIDFSHPEFVRRRRLRALKDRLAKVSIGVGGMSVIIAIMLIFVYLLSEVLPMFKSASMAQSSTYALPAPQAGQTLMLAIEEQTQVGLRVTDQGRVVFFNATSGALISEILLPLPEAVRVTSLAQDAAHTGLVALGLSDGTALVFQHRYSSRYVEDQRLIEPRIEYPYGEAPLVLDPGGQAIQKLALRAVDERMLLVGVTAAQQLVATRYEQEENFLTGETRVESSVLQMAAAPRDIRFLQVDVDLKWLFAIGETNALNLYQLQGEQAQLHSRLSLTEGARVTDVAFLLGGISLLVGDETGQVQQWFMVRSVGLRQEQVWSLRPVRSFQSGAEPVHHLLSEQRRKGFISANEQGQIHLFNTTAQRTLLAQQVAPTGLRHLAIAPRANALLVEAADGIRLWAIDNQHPEVSWTVLWEKVWYESYSEPEFIWQSSSASNDFEPKLSLMPLAFGTLKAAFYAMLLAAPLAICGAIFTAHFMAPTMRRKIKPMIELMEALPTVILGFLAGLWLAPMVEANLPGIFSLLVLTPLAILLMSFAWAQLPQSWRAQVSEGWYAALLIPVIVMVGWICLALSAPLENAFFGGDMRSWLTHSAGISFDQRNSLVVGLAMGFAVIPTIFSITEDAIFSVPKHLTNGSLALGATQWQTLVRVVLLTASPGIFSAVMIGFGRAVGETMIVLMATGNTPIMEWNIFEGMRTLAANIAVEMPESEVGSTHYRVLFLAAFVLFIFTFVFNTVAEVVRQRLRRKYGAL